jgi:hypothetical protein
LWWLFQLYAMTRQGGQSGLRFSDAITFLSRMKKLTALVKWIWLAWPILVPMLLGLVHCLFFSITGKNPFAHKLFAAGLQVIGGLLVLYSINANMGVFRNHGLATAIRNYLQEFPLRNPRSHIIKASTGNAFGFSGAAAVSFGRAPVTLKEKIAALEKEVSAIRELIAEREKVLHGRIDEVGSQVQKSSEEHRQRIDVLSDRLERTVVGGVKLQAFGAILVAYGAVLSVYL